MLPLILPDYVTEALFPSLYSIILRTSPPITCDLPPMESSRIDS